jgi:hypothetical protein
MTEDKREQLQRLETALQLREKTEHSMRLTKYNYEQMVATVIVDIAGDNRLGNFQLQLAQALLDERCIKAFHYLQDAERQLTHTNDTVTLIQAEISLWEKGKE